MSKSRPSCLSDAFKACVDHAASKLRMSMDRIADAMGQPNPWSLYKWIAGGNMPTQLIRPFERACGCTFVTEYLAASTGKHVLISVPTGRIAQASDIQALQEACTQACAAVIQFYRGAGGNDPLGTVAVINTAIARLATERAHVSTHSQPEFDFNE